jgi:hypothetical protein
MSVLLLLFTDMTAPANSATSMAFKFHSPTEEACSIANSSLLLELASKELATLLESE